MAITALSTTTVTRRRFTVSEYYAMGEAGIFGDGERVELIEGEIFQLPKSTPLHAGHVLRLNRLWSRRLGEQMLVSVHNPVRLDEFSEPEPDLALLKFRADFYKHAHPTPLQTLLVAEVAETGLDYDRDVKVPLYARAKIPEMWLANLPEKRLEVFRDPGPKGYKTRQLLDLDDTISPLAFPDVTFRISEILE